MILKFQSSIYCGFQLLCNLFGKILKAKKYENYPQVINESIIIHKKKNLQKKIHLTLWLLKAF